MADQPVTVDVGPLSAAAAGVSGSTSTGRRVTLQIRRSIRPHTTEPAATRMEGDRGEDTHKGRAFAFTMDSAHMPPAPVAAVAAQRPNSSPNSHPMQHTTTLIHDTPKQSHMTFAFDEKEVSGSPRGVGSLSSSPHSISVRGSRKFTIRSAAATPNSLSAATPRIDSNRVDRSFSIELKRAADQLPPVDLPGPSAAQLSARIQQATLLNIARPASAAESNAENAATLAPQSGSLRKHRRGIIGVGPPPQPNMSHATASGGGSRGSVLLRADYLAELAQRSKVDLTGDGDSMAFRHSFLFSGNQKLLEAALQKQRAAAAAEDPDGGGEGEGDAGDGGRPSDSSSEEDDIEAVGDDIRPELMNGVGFSIRREVDAPKLHPASKQLIRMDPATIAADHYSLHAHLTEHAPIIAARDLGVVEHWLTEMAIKYQRKMEGEQSFTHTGSASYSSQLNPDSVSQHVTSMSTDTAGEYQSALDRAGLGRRILEKAGMATNLADRCYIGFFTYTIGFYDCVYHMCSHVSQRPKLMSLIWKVYLWNLEHAEPEMYEWVIECVRTENARREDLKRQEHQHRCAVLKQHTKLLKKKVKIMKVNDMALSSLQSTEQQSIRMLGTNLRDMQHAYEMDMELKSNIYTSITEWTMNSYEMESATHHVHGNLQQLHSTRITLHADIGSLSKKLHTLQQGIAEEHAKKAKMQADYDNLQSDITQIEADITHSEQHLHHLLENAQVYKKLISEEEMRIRELEDISHAQELYMDLLGESGLHTDLTAAAQDATLRRLQADCARSRSSRPAATGMDQSPAARLRECAPPASLDIDHPPAGFDPITGEMTPAELERRGLASQEAEMHALRAESKNKLLEFEQEEARLTAEIASERERESTIQAGVEQVQQRADERRTARDTALETQRQTELLYIDLSETQMSNFQREYARLQSLIDSHGQDLLSKQSLLASKRTLLQDLLYKITDLSNLEESSNLHIESLNQEQHQHTERKVQLELLIEQLNKQHGKKEHHYKLLQDEAAPLYTNYTSRLAILKKELQLHEKEKQIHEGMMRNELKGQKAKEEALKEIQAKVDEAMDKCKQITDKTNELNAQMQVRSTPHNTQQSNRALARVASYPSYSPTRRMLCLALLCF